MVFKGDRIKQLTDPSFSVGRIQPRPQGFSLKKWPQPFFKGKALGTRLVRIIGQRKVLSIQVFRFKGRKYSLLCLLDFVAFTDLFIYLKISMRREKNVVSRLGMRIFPCRDFHKRNLATVNSFMAERKLCDNHSTDFIIHYTCYLYSYWLRACR